ncbi:MAG: hypothetical protein HKN82_11775 [Akkermansiaceae bacterium]|nr:hypothetical protein [Akkermansiaceae bacterium]NNM27903.1 hypothetical protein [Akkermansiaceae bacterium]
MNEPPSTEAEASTTPSPRGGKSKWVLFLGLALYLLLTAPNSLLGLIMGVGGDGWGGTLELKERIALLILGTNLPFTLAALVIFGAGLRRPPIRRRAVLLLLGLGLACVAYSILADVVFGVDIY